ncbi:phosphoethanolamine transferase [uncultured Bacteroides sp.]|uniref:phosphoethanolamine transferase n=1 Tax=uncultured Bacteroides sp. TaxID=162156 RepID=UPI0026772C0A|nr:phosphoethanolamine transferase [uncultured Bacteroides sp.]
MKLFKNVKNGLAKQEHLFYLFLFILITPNIVLCFTEPLPVMAKVTNVLLPLGCYYLLMTLSGNCGKMFWILFLFLFFGAFQIVLLYLFGQSVIAVDMFLNLVTTNSSEALELLDHLTPAIIAVIMLYVPALALGMVSIVRKRTLPERFVRRERKRALAVLGISLAGLFGTFALEPGYELKSDLYPLNVCYNVGLAFQRTLLTRNYHHTSRDFTFHAKATHPAGKREIYVMVVGETSRAPNWQLYGYGRETNPLLAHQEGLVAFSKALTESNTTHKSVPMLLSGVSARNYDSIYFRKGIITAFKEAGFRTAFFSNQRRNHSFIDFFGMEADTCDFIKEDSVAPGYNPADDELLRLAEQELAKGAERQFIVLHTYGSHFNYRERYPLETAFFTPDYPVDAKRKFRDNLVNAYDNSIRYTDGFLSGIIRMLEKQQANAVMLYTSDHGEDIFDDSRHLFLHASPVPSYYQLHVPFLVWMSEEYRENYPGQWKAVTGNKDKDVSSSSSFFPTMLDLGGIETDCWDRSQSVATPFYTMKPRVYLNDHNEPCPLDGLGMKKPDFQQLEQRRIDY